MKLLILVVCFTIGNITVLANNDLKTVSESGSTNGTDSRQSRQYKIIKRVDYGEINRPRPYGPPSRIMPRIGSNTGPPPGYYMKNGPNNRPNMMIRRRVQSLPTNLFMKARKPQMIGPPLPPPQALISSRPQAVKPNFARGPGKSPFPMKLPQFTKAQISAAENKFKASVPFNGKVIMKANPNSPPAFSSNYKYETPAANSIKANVISPYKEKGYSVYEITDDFDMKQPLMMVASTPQQQHQQPIQHQTQQQMQQNWQTVYQQRQPQYQQLQQQAQQQLTTDEAQRYLAFMGSNEYFLPKNEPDYKRMSITSQKQAPQQQPQKPVITTTNHEHQFFDIQKQQPRSQPQIAPTTPVLTYYTPSSELKNEKFSYPVNYYSDDQSESGNFPSFKGSPPERIEFTENDAIHGTYTTSPVLKAYEDEQQKIFSSLNRRYSQDEHEERPEERSDRQDELVAEASENDQNYSRTKVEEKKVNKEAGNNEVIKPDPKTEDTEDYCERMCANVHDDDEQVICGSDGFMYTSEAQLECYASCLNIEVTIQGKGSCS